MLAKLIAVIAVIYLIKTFLYPFYKLVGKSQKEKARQYAKNRDKEERERKRREQKRKYAQIFAKPFISQLKRDRLKKKIDRLMSDKTPEEIVFEQQLWLLGTAVVSAIMLSGNLLLGLFTVLLVPICYNIPTDELDKEIRRKNQNVAAEFPEFYTMVFYQYSKSINIYLADVIKDYISNANDDFKDELGVMLDNIERQGEQFALKQLKRRVPLHHIIKFCDIMETRLRGYDNVSQMQYLKNEIDAFRITSLETELAKRVRFNNVVQITLIGILVLYIIIYYLFQILGSLKMFQ